MTETRIPVAVLGATGAMGQRIVALLQNHPWFFPSEFVASERSAGRRYADASHWMQPDRLRPDVADIVVGGPGASLDSPVVLSALGSEVARELEPRFAREGHLVVSNSKAFRLDPHVPIVVGGINSARIDSVRPETDGEGLIVANADSGVAGLALVLFPLHAAFGLKSATVCTLESSGGVYPGLAAIEMSANRLPFIPDEEKRTAAELLRILDADFDVSVAAHIVPAIEGHVSTVFVSFQTVPADGIDLVEQASSVLARFGQAGGASVDSTPSTVLTARSIQGSARVDYSLGSGLLTSITRMEADSVFDLRMTVASRNLEQGAAGATIGIAEAAVERGLARRSLRRLSLS